MDASGSGAKKRNARMSLINAQEASDKQE